MDAPRSQQAILQQLKMRGPQSIKILATQLDMTTMGIRQHMAELQSRGLVEQVPARKQTRGRPVHLWILSESGHRQFPDSHEEITVDLIRLVREQIGETALNRLIDTRNLEVQERYRQALEAGDSSLQSQLDILSQLRSQDGYMAEVRMIPDNEWLLIENHCPICAAAKSCQQFCRSELAMFNELLAGKARVKRVDYVLEGARRCAYRISPNAD